jgi:hypothetical protein
MVMRRAFASNSILVGAGVSEMVFIVAHFVALFLVPGSAPPTAINGAWLKCMRWRADSARKMRQA